MSKKMKRSPFLVGSSGNGIPSPGTFLKYLGLKQERIRKGNLEGNPEQHLDRSHATLLTSPQAQSSHYNFHHGWLFSARTGWEERVDWLTTGSLLPENPFTLISGGGVQKSPFRYGKRQGEKVSEQTLGSGEECWAAEQSFPCRGPFLVKG